MIRVVAAPRAIHGFRWNAARMTMNSPTKPLVPGRPALAMKNSMAKVANHGITLTTPP
ncbi:hypothetical protein D3C72_991950 [compost metagenome]